MSQQVENVVQTRRISLSVYIPLLLAAAAVIPLLAALLSLESFLRPQLVDQVNTSLERDAQTRVQLIDTYLAERLNDTKLLSQADPIKSLLAGDQGSRKIAENLLAITQHRDQADFISLSLLNNQGDLAIASYPSAPLRHGRYLILPEDVSKLQSSDEALISDVFYDQAARKASVDLYARVVDKGNHILGFVRISLGLQRVWDPVNRELQENGTDSIAFILDNNKIRIAYSNPDHSGATHSPYLFKAIQNMPQDLQQRIKDEDLYGNSSTPVTVAEDQNLATLLQQGLTSNQFQVNPAGENEIYQGAKYKSSVASWTYYILKPTNSITSLVDQQLISFFLIVVLVLILAVFVGIVTGRRIATPILNSVISLRKNSAALKTLADEEHEMATEQGWMVEASQVALDSVKYYTKAADVAAQRILSISTELRQSPQSAEKLRNGNTLNEMMETAAYIERAIKHLETMNEKLSTSLRVTTQVTEQLTRGAKSTDEAATQLNKIVDQLTDVVGE
ncbi:hypothetical protein EPA93_35245 [Ktedonosporobacter rubrisoli]|uniref:Cache domain-containing protein n=1 Tax=Ktedonosporobacter rubrisoli TaxID=2509675 RepID=A0A4P6JZM0_KTERU|nr:cache domain-containing protein [Ktedonosporobacter rubrisoli]QBD80943.1 hypothetical protein EPA93_35245 [Ktedonosporobacter rubrisoli]